MPFRKDILGRIWPIELDFSGLVLLSNFCKMNIHYILSKICTETYVGSGFSVSDLTGHHFMSLIACVAGGISCAGVFVLEAKP